MTFLDTGDFTVASGEIVALLGANGAGKTTLMETILGFRGERPIRLFDQDVSALSVERRVVLGVGYVPELRRLFASLTVRENLEASSRLPTTQRRQRVDEMLAAFPMLGERPDARAWLLSGGQQQMLVIGRALMTSPRLMAIDEPSLGLAPKIIDQVYEILMQLLAQRKLTLLIVEQSSTRAMMMGGRMILMRGGRIVLEGAAGDMVKDERLKQAYFGLGDH